jgi:UDP:flavonoid glycosyltransferase YjiC (YdhE family)
MRRPTIVIFVMAGHGHFASLSLLAKALVALGADVCVFTRDTFADAVRAAGARFSDLYPPGRSLDDTSLPRPVRFVPFAAAHADTVAAEVAALRPSLIVADTHGVVAGAVANILGLPFVCVSAAHDDNPDTFVDRMLGDRRLSISTACLDAVDVLRERFGMADASPFLFGTMRSAQLNLCCEPEQFVSEETRRALEPVAFFGALPPSNELGPLRMVDVRRPIRHVYVSFGTIVLSYAEGNGPEALELIAAAVSERPGMRATISLGGIESALPGVARPKVAVEPWVDQWRLLAEADLFITHHGLNSTHEAIYHAVPMLSFPFRGDQPRMAERTERLGLSVPLGQALGGPLTRERLDEALDAVEELRGEMVGSLEKVRRWELEALEGRPEVAERILAFA